MLTVNAVLRDSEVEIVSFREVRPFHANGVSNPFPVLRETTTALSEIHTLSVKPSPFTSIKLYSVSATDETTPIPAEKLPEALFIGHPKPAPALNPWDWPP